MRAVHPDSTSTSADALPLGLFGYQEAGTNAAGYFQDLAELEYRLLDATRTEVTTWTVVDVDRDSVSTDALLTYTQGLYAPAVSVPASTSYGTWTLEWRFRVTTGAAQLTAATTFRVVDPAHPLVDGYAQVQDLLDEGVPTTSFTVARMGRSLDLASRLFEEWTGRYFAPRLLSVEMDGEGGPIKQMAMPIVGIAGIRFTSAAWSSSELPVLEGDIRVYNRHVRNRLARPDDRDDPRIEFQRFDRRSGRLLHGETDHLFASRGFPSSQQNLSVGGVFGYTDWDGSPFGKTPDLVSEAVMRIALRKLQPLYLATGGGTSVGVAGPIKREKTFDQSVEYSDAAVKSGSGAFIGAFSGDPEIDQIILTYRRPPILRSTLR